MTETTLYPVKIAVCDDEALDCQQIMQLTAEILKTEGLPCELFAFKNGPALLGALQRGNQFQILLLDVLMDQMNGIELAAALRRQGDNTAIIFISVNREMALRGYEVTATRYLAKPLKTELLREALLHCFRTLERKTLLLPTGKGHRRIELSNLIYAEAAERITKLFLVGQQEAITMKISDLEALLPERQFTLCHRSYLVNLDFVSYLRRRELELTTGETIPVSKYRLGDVQKKLVHYLKD